MPTFDFECAKCKNIFEFSRPFGSKVNPACPKCKSKKTAKLFSAPTIVFKGEGWYKTTGRKQSKETKESGQSKEPAKSDAKTPKTPDAPRAAKIEKPKDTPTT